MDDVLTLDQIKRLFPNQWVLIAYTRLDEDQNIVRGKVVANASSRDEIYDKLQTAQDQKIAIEFTGDQPSDIAYLL